MRHYKDPIRTAFLWHKANAKGRNIEFGFTIEKWIAVWAEALGPEWFQMRGARKGQYVMARKGDTGPYVGWNVDIIPHEVNASDGAFRVHARMKVPHPRGTSHPACRLTEKQVKAIFLSTLSCPILAKMYNVHCSTIRAIKSRRNWSHITNGL